MKRERIIAILFIHLLAVIGCGHTGGDGARPTPADEAHAPEAEAGVSFSAKSGLLVPAVTAQFIGLQVMDVEERKVSSTVRFVAQVYRPATGAQLALGGAGAPRTALASGAVDAAQAAQFREGQPVMAVADRTNALAGRILSVNRTLEQARGQVEVLLAIDDKKARLVKSAFVTVTVPQGGEKPVASVPCQALLRTTEGVFVYTVSGEHFVRTAVKLGIVNEEFAGVTDGLLEGDKVVVQPVMTLWMAELQSIRGGKACADGH